MLPTSLVRPAETERPARRVVVRLDPRRIWRWQVWLLESLSRAGTGEVAVAFGPGRPLPAALRLLLSLERQVYRLHGEQAADLLDPRDVRAAWADPSADPPDLVIDLTGGEADGSCIRPLYGGLAGDDALIGALLGDAPVRLRIAGSARRSGADLLPAVESRTVLTRCLNRVFSTVLSLCLAEAQRPSCDFRSIAPDDPGGIAAIAEPSRRDAEIGLAGVRGASGSAARADDADFGTHRPRPVSGPRSGDVAASRAGGSGPVAVGAFLARAVASKLADRLTRLCTTAPRWRVGWRPLSTEADDTGHTGRIPAGGYALLPDDGGRYYADPFILTGAGRRFLFVEEYGYASSKGLISVAEIDGDGRIGTPRPVIEEPHHLSYPFVFTHAGAHYMIPESAACRRVELYRAARLPDRWERVAILLDDIAAADVTLTRTDGTWWMFACTHPWQSSVRDTLSLFSAPDLFGPWTPHPQNPVVVDLRAARPGGALFRKGGRLWRPAQDGSDGYGSALSLCRVDRLTPTEYRQSLETILRPGGPWARDGLHTLNRGGGIEVVDGLF
ncbi:MAG: formyl transferase [Methylobacterium frigidaeris]